VIRTAQIARSGLATLAREPHRTTLQLIERRRWAAGYPPTIAHCLTPVAGRSADVRRDPSYRARSEWLRAGTRSRPGGPGRETSKGSAWIPGTSSAKKHRGGQPPPHQFLYHV